MTTNTAGKKSNKKGTVKSGASAPALPSAPKVTLSGDDALTVKSALQTASDRRAKLGALRERYLQDELAALTEIQKAQQSLEAVIHTLAEKHGVDFKSGQWVFQLDRMTFTPRAQ